MIFFLNLDVGSNRVSQLDILEAGLQILHNEDIR